MGGARFDAANLSRANLAGADCHWASFIDADLSGVNARRTDFTMANLRNAILDDTELEEADLTDTWPSKVTPDQIAVAKPRESTELPADVAAAPAVRARIEKAEARTMRGTSATTSRLPRAVMRSLRRADKRAERHLDMLQMLQSRRY
ncbi:hypothetical protein Srufu_070350 [Streptomyces libani subsp. rufus]|nr:hypothetical protein Srufu_070350 [Streptomyces libani subsp. rufus]